MRRAKTETTLEATAAPPDEIVAMRERISFEPNQRLRLGLPGDDRDLAVEVVRVDDDLVWLRFAEPPRGIEAHQLAAGVRLSFWRDGARHVADSVPVADFDLDAGRLQLRRPAATRVARRRRTFREPATVPVRLSPVDREPATVDLGPRDAITQDIGGGGICARTEGAPGLGVDDEVQVELALPDRTVRARGRVCWSRTEEDGATRLGVAFTRIAEREQDQVYGFLFELQRSRLRTS